MTTLAILGGFGLPELLVVFALLVLNVFLVWPAWRILTKAGFPGWLGIGALIPLINFALLVFVAFSEWPIERDLREARRR